MPKASKVFWQKTFEYLRTVTFAAIPTIFLINVSKCSTIHAIFAERKATPLLSQILFVAKPSRSFRSTIVFALTYLLTAQIGNSQVLQLQDPLVLPTASSQADIGFGARTAFNLSEPIDKLASEGKLAEQDSIEKLTQRIADIESQLKNNLDAGKKKEFKPAKAENPLDKYKEKWTVKLGGHVQLDYINWANASPTINNAQDYFEFRRLRLVADGTGYGQYDFRLQMTLEPETIGETLPLGTVASPDVKDAYLSMNEIPMIGRARIGNFFVPFSLEQVTNDTNNTFMERSIPTQGIFTPDREVGIAFYNATEEKNVTWSSGAFFDSISEGLKERIDDNQGYRLSGRVTWLPYYDEASNGRYMIHTGMGILHTDDQDNRVRFRARPQVREGPRLISSGILNANSYTTGNLETAIISGPFAIQSEAFLSSVNMTVGDNRQVQGCYVHTSCFLTGENRIFERFGQHGAQFGRNVPKDNFFVSKRCAGSGAWELKSRWSYLDLHQLDSGQYNDLTCGLNWYWSDRTRIMFDWIHPITSAGTTFGATNSDLLAMRFDFNW